MIGVKRERGVILLGRFLDESIPIRKEDTPHGGGPKSDGKQRLAGGVGIWFRKGAGAMICLLGAYFIVSPFIGT